MLQVWAVPISVDTCLSEYLKKPAKMTWKLFKKNPNPEPIIAASVAPPAPPTTAVSSVVSNDNSTESGPVESKEDVFAQIKEKFMNEINKIPCKYPLSTAFCCQLLRKLLWVYLPHS